MSSDDLVTVTPETSGTSSRPSRTAEVLQPGHTVNNRYRIIKLLGQGGMGAVYQAWDDEVNEAVALKVILPRPDEDPASLEQLQRRFKKELQLARHITHRNVVRIHDIGEVEGIKFISMSFIKGQDLAKMLKDGPLPVPRALAFARQIASGLAAAHEAGVVHRDLKPANIMIEEVERALLMDFGIARSLQGDTGPGSIVGTVVGTLAYMAPEQARGEPVDARADVYAFGLILYEMLTGRRQTGDSAISDLVSRMNAAPAPIRSLNPLIPEPVDALVTRCLQPAAVDRYQSSAELLEVLNGLDAEGYQIIRPALRPATPKLLLAAVALILTAVGITWWIIEEPPPPAAREPVSVLIADFDNRAGDPVFSGSLENALTVAMEGASFITSFQRANAQAIYAQVRPGAPFDESGARLVSRREGVSVVLAGMIEGEGGGYRITVRAIDPIPGTLVTTASATADTKSEVLAAVGSIAAQLREALGDTTTESGKLAASETFTASSLEAAQHYSRAQELSYSAKYEEAIAAYREALQRDPNLGRAYAGWALAASILGRTEEAEALYKQALARLDRMTEREKYRTLGTYYSRVARNPEKAIESFSLLVEKYPADASALNNLAVGHFNALDFAKALEYGARLVSVYPEQALWRNNFALYAMYAGDFENAGVHAQAALKRNPDTPKSYLALAMAQVATGRIEEGVTWWNRAAKSSAQGASLAAIGHADLALYFGRHADAEALLPGAIATDRQARNTAGVVAKLIARAEAQQLAGDRKGSIALAKEALRLSTSEAIAVPAARVMLASGRRADALGIAAELGKRLNPQARAYGKVIESEAALQEGRTVEAVEAARAALKLADLWLVRYTLGVAYVQAGAYAEALSELEACDKRRGEATSVFLNDVPSWRYMAPLTYWLGRAREGVGLKNHALGSYRTYVALRPPTLKDALADDARRRLGG